MPVAHSSSSEKSVGAGSPRSVSVISRLRRVAASRRTYSPARSARDRGDVRERLALRLAGVVEQRAAGADRERQVLEPKPASVAAPSCLQRARACRSRRRTATAGSRVDEVAVRRLRRRRRPAPRRARCAAARCRAPAARSRRRAACRSRARATRARRVRLSRCRRKQNVVAPCRPAAPESVSVPGVTMRVTLRSTGPLAVAGSPICSQIATDSPSFTSFARYCSTACNGTPAILIGAPADCAALRERDVEQPRRASRRRRRTARRSRPSGRRAACPDARP